jgi:hypothetical protein
VKLVAGAYLRTRREAAGLSLGDVARAYVHHGLDNHAARLLFAEAEAGTTVLNESTLLRLTGVFRFDPEIYLALAEGIPVSVCRVCACSWNDPCTGAPHGGCAWTDASETLCTACSPAAIVRPTVFPGISA